MKRIAIIGAGLSGLMTAHIVKQSIDAEVIVLEKGDTYERRINSKHPSLVCGIGGAGTIYGGKFCMPPSSSRVWEKTNFNQARFEHFSNICINSFTTKEEQYKYKPTINKIDFSHLSHNIEVKDYQSILYNKSKMQDFIKNILKCLILQKVIIKNGCDIKSIEKNNRGFKVKYLVEKLDINYEYYDIVIMASGRESASNIQKILDGMIPVFLTNPDMGIRINMNLDELGGSDIVGKDLKLKAKIGDIGVRTFCACSGGDKTIVDSKELLYYDGHFGDELTKKSNVGILARNPRLYGYESAIRYCDIMKNFLNEDLSLKDFCNYSNRFVGNNYSFEELMSAIKEYIRLLQEGGILGNNLDIYQAWLPSVDRLNPYIHTNRSFETSCPNLYVVGDAAGISRGFVQALWTAYCAGEDITKKLQEKEVKRIV